MGYHHRACMGYCCHPYMGYFCHPRVGYLRGSLVGYHCHPRVGGKGHPLAVLLVTQYRPQVQPDGEEAEGAEVRHQFGERAALEIDHAHHLDEVAQGIEPRDVLRPRRHTAYGREQPAHQDEDHQEEEHDEQRLLHGGGVVADDQPQARHHEDVDGGEEVDGKHVARRHQPVCRPCEEHGVGEHEEAHRPVGHEFGEDEGELAHGRDVHLLDGALLLLAHDVEGGQEAGEQREHHHHQRGHHEHLVVEVRVELVVGRSTERLPTVGGIAGSALLTQVSGEVGDDAAEVGRAEPRLRAVDGIGRYHHPARSTADEVLLEIVLNLQYQVGIARLHAVQRLVIGWRHIGQREVFRGIRLLHQPLRVGAVVVVHHAQFQPLHLLVGSPRHDEQHHGGEHEEQLGQELVAHNLLELLFYQIFDNHSMFPPCFIIPNVS